MKTILPEVTVATILSIILLVTILVGEFDVVQSTDLRRITSVLILARRMGTEEWKMR